MKTLQSTYIHVVLIVLLKKLRNTEFHFPRNMEFRMTEFRRNTEFHNLSSAEFQRKFRKIPVECRNMEFH